METKSQYAEAESRMAMTRGRAEQGGRGNEEMLVGGYKGVIMEELA